MALPNQGEYARNDKCYVVSGIKFENNEGGYLLAGLPIESLSDTLFRERYILDKLAVVALNGEVLADGMENTPRALDESVSFWEQLPPGISRDTIKLAISQKNVYKGRINDYGYIVVVPYNVAGGGAVAFVTEEAMEIMTKDEMGNYDMNAIKVAISAVVLIGMIFLSNFLSDTIENQIRKKRFRENSRDLLTGLLNKDNAIREIARYIDDEGKKRGVMFIIELSDVSGGRESRGDAFVDEKIKEFALSLENKFRATDIVARIADDRFLVFLKDVLEQKDIRKQADEMQLFLHDTTFYDADKEVAANAGAAVYPDNGRNITETIVSAERALERAKAEGKGKLSF